MNKVEFGIYFKNLRKKNNLSLKNVSDYIFVSIQSINKYEKGLNYPDTSSLGELAKLFNVDLDSLVSLKNENNNNYHNEYKFDINKFASSFSFLRKYNNYSLTQMASIIGVQYQTISKWEKGESLPNIEQLVKCAELFKVTVSNLYYAINETDKITKKKPKRKRLIIIPLLLLTLFFSIFTTSATLLLGGAVITNFLINNVDNGSIKRPYNVEATIAINYYNLDDSIEMQEQSIYQYNGKFYASDSIEYVYNNTSFDVLACEKGTVIDINEDPDYGNLIYIKGNSGHTYIYGSLKDITVKINDKVRCGDHIAKAGTNIIHASLQNHLHLKILDENDYDIDPKDLFLENEQEKSN